jgi:hypothetical protein
MIPSTFKNIRAALANLNPAEVRASAERVVIVGLTASRGERFMAMESFLAPPDLSREERVEALRHVYHTDIPGAPAGFDIEIQDEALPPRRGVFDFRLGDPALTVKQILRHHEGLALPLARLFPPFREEVCRQIVRRISKENALFSMATALPNVVPSVFELPWAVGEFASDTTILTANQIRMAFLLAAASDREVGYGAQKAEMGSIIAGAFGWRALARELVGKVPFGGGLIPKAAVAYAGTFVVGKSIVRLHRFGRGLSRSERKSEYRTAFARGRQIAATLLEGLQRDKKG